MNAVGSAAGNGAATGGSRGVRNAPSAPPPFLGVENSLTGRRWVGLDAEADRLALRIAQVAGIPDPVARTLAVAGVTAETAADYLDPRLRDLMPNPSHLLDAERAAERLVTAARTRQRVSVLADYDVDGAASAALIVNWFRELGSTVSVYVPDRVAEGYGPNETAMRTLSADSDLIICADCGTNSYQAVAAASVDVIVLDHHLGSDTLPYAHAVVNPNRVDESGELGHLCAAGVVFLVLAAANRRLRGSSLAPPDLIPLLDLVALATVADVAPLVGVNRAFVRQGLRVMARRNRIGLAALADAARQSGPPTEFHLGFILGPRLNAAGRIGTADLGARLLATTDAHEAAAISSELETLNNDRRELEAATFAAALEQAERRGLDGPLIWAADDGWHPGVVGIVASRLMRLANRPALVIGFDGEEGKGSGRSVPGVNLGAAVSACVRENLFEKGGGHPMAAGVAVTRACLGGAIDRLSELLERQGAGRVRPRTLRLTGTMQPGAATVELVGQLQAAGPFGSCAPAPRLALAGVKVARARQVGESHLMLTFRGNAGDRVEAMAFRAFDSALGRALSSHGGQSHHVAGQLEINDWGGRRSARLLVEDAAPLAARAPS